jgi:hypothetical protein
MAGSRGEGAFAGVVASVGRPGDGDIFEGKYLLPLKANELRV